VFDGYEERRLWRAANGRTTRLDLAPLLGFQIRSRLGELWVATAFDAAPDDKTQWMLRTTDTTEVGPGFTAFVFASADEGATWNRIDSYSGAIVHAAWLGPNGELRWWLSDRSIRSITLDPHTGRALREATTLAEGEQGPNGDWAHWLAFPDERTGLAEAHFFFQGFSTSRSPDGGRTWSSTRSTEEFAPWTQGFTLGGGACVRIIRPFGAPASLELWRDGDFHELRRFETKVHDSRVDSVGGLLVRFDNAEVWRLSPDASEWTRLGRIAIPPR